MASSPSSSSSSVTVAVLNTVLLTATSCKQHDRHWFIKSNSKRRQCRAHKTVAGKVFFFFFWNVISHLSFWVGQENLDVLASAPRVLVLPDKVIGRAGAHTCIRCPDLQQTVMHFKSKSIPENNNCINYNQLQDH